jgi:hypothetical protein
MAETKPTAGAAVKSPSSAQPKKSGNTISWMAPLLCIIFGYVIWRFVLGAPSNLHNLIRMVVFGHSTKDLKVHSPKCMKVVSSFLS